MTFYSNAHYVGYVEDEESVEAIMKKFEELERIQKEFSGLQVKATEEPEQDKENVDAEMIDAIESKEDLGLTQEQLEEVFKRTSAFTVKSATIDMDQIEDLDALELWQIEYKDGSTAEFYEEE